MKPEGTGTTIERPEHTVMLVRLNGIPGLQGFPRRPKVDPGFLSSVPRIPDGLTGQ